MTAVLKEILNVNIPKQMRIIFFVLLKQIIFTVQITDTKAVAAAATCPSGWTRPSVVREARQKWGRWCCFVGLHSNFYLGQKQTCMSEKNCAASVTRDSARRSTATAGNYTNVRVPFLQKAVGCKLDPSHSTIVIWSFFSLSCRGLF